MRGPMSIPMRCGSSVVGVTLCLCGWLSLAGCAHIVETRAIKLFAEAVEQGNLDQLKTATSTNFEELALRQEVALEDMKILRLPTGEIEIVEVKEVSPTIKRVSVRVGESKQRLKYQLKLDPSTKKWVVDDIYLSQKHDGVSATKSVTEQMDLLLSVREFLDAWKNGDREAVLNSTTPEFAELLKPLPPAYLNRLTQQIVGRRTTAKPRARLDDNIAYVQIPISVGELVLTLKRANSHWAVDEAAITSREEKDAIASTRQLAQITTTATAFLNAYHDANKDQLQTLCTTKFFTGSLLPANLSLVSLPGGDLPQSAVQIHVATSGIAPSDTEETRQLEGKHSDFVVESSTEVLKLSLVREDGADSSIGAKYLIEDVTVYDLASKQEKRLSALFTAHELVQLFAEALVSRDLEALKLSSSPDFKNRVWKGMQVGLLHELPLTEIEDAPPKVQSTVFNGAVTEVTVTQGSRALTYLLQDRQGELFVDDILMPTIGRPSSLKTTLELMHPILNFAAGSRLQHLNLLQRSSSRDFNRLVWHQTPTVPNVGLDVVQHLHAPLVSIEQTEDRAVIVLGDDKFGAQVTLVRESGQHVVDELVLISGTMPRDHVEMKRSLRMHIATYGVGKSSREESNTVVPAAAVRR